MALDPVSDVGAGGSLVLRVLELARNQLLLDVAWLSELVGDRLVMRAVTGDAESFGLDADWSYPSGPGAVDAIRDGAVGSHHVFPALSNVGAQVAAAVLLADGQP